VVCTVKSDGLINPQSQESGAVTSNQVHL
jgi:hypothetical protein